MEIGLLWYDDDPRRALEDKIGQAAQRYREKYGRWPNTCYVHPQDVADGTGQDLSMRFRLKNSRTTIRVVSAANILLHHFWLGESSARPVSKQRKAMN